MKSVVFKALLFLALIGISFAASRVFLLDSGYVLIAFQDYTIEGSLWSVLLALIVVLLAIKILFSCLRMVITGTDTLLPISVRARRRKAQRLSNKGLIQFANGYWKNAEKWLGRAGDAGSAPLLNYLLAARAASFNNDLEKAKEYLRKADSTTPGAALAIGITQAEIQLSHQHMEQALATLSSLHKQSPKHVYILKLLQQAHQELGDWQALAKLLPTLSKLKVLNNSQLEKLEHKVYDELFTQARNQGRKLPTGQRTEPANTVWSSLGKAQRKNKDLVLSYAHILYDLDAQEEAETFIREQLSIIYSPELIQLYGKLNVADSNLQLLTAEALLGERPSDPELLLALGRISTRAKLWGKAKEYLETSLKLNHTAATYNELGLLLAHLNEHEKSSGYFQQGLALAAEKSS